MNRQKNSRPRHMLRPTLLAAGALVVLSACGDSALDWDLRPRTDGPSTADAARQATAQRPTPDARGVISYPGYQVVVARRGETVETVAQRLEIDAADLARFNAIERDTVLRQGEVLALPRRLDGPGGTGTGGIDVSTIATTAIDRAGDGGGQATPFSRAPEPVRHQVGRGETAYSIARLYNVPVRSLADWNGLGPDLAVREGQYLLIPVSTDDRRTAAAEPLTAITPRPGAGSSTPTPPSAAQPLPQGDPAVEAAPERPPSPDLGAERTAASAGGGGRLGFPVQGPIIREFQKGRNDGIAIGASPGTPVRAAADGVVATISRDTDQVPIVLIRHDDNLVTVYANVEPGNLERGARVRRGDTIATIRPGDPSFVHFEVRRGFDSVDPMEFLR